VVDYRTEEEQIDAVKQWWGENGRAVILAVVIGLGGSYGWGFWQDSNQEQGEQAAREYWQFIEFLEQDFISIETSKPEIKGDKIKSNFPDSNYSKFAAMHLARVYVEAEMFDNAKRELEWVIKTSNTNDAVFQLAEIRLARILAAMGDSSQAIEILSSNQETSFKILRATALGDIMWSLGEKDAALKEYRVAKNLSDRGFTAPRLVEKLNFLRSTSTNVDGSVSSSVNVGPSGTIKIDRLGEG